MAGTLSYSLSLATRGFTGPLGAATGALRGLGSGASAAAGLLTKLVAPLAAISGGVGIFAALSKAADFEQLSVSLRVLVGDADEAQRVLGELKSFANATPFEFSDVAAAGKTLIALGGSTKTVRAELTALGDIASGLSIPLGELALAYGKARNDGVLYAETLNQFNDKGIPVLEKLAEAAGFMADGTRVSTTEIKKMASEGKIGFSELQKVLSDLTKEGGQFFGLMEQQSGTTKGLLSTLKSAFDDLLVSVGTPINDFLKPVLATNIGRMAALTQRTQAFLSLLKSAGEQGKLGEFIGASLQLGFINAVNTLSGGIRSVVAYLAGALPVIFKAALDELTSERTQLFFTGLFNSIGEALKSNLQDGASAILGALPGGKFSGGAKDLKDASDASSARSGNYLQLAKAALASADLGATIDKLAGKLAEAEQAGQAAAAAVSKNPLIDPTIARAKFAELGKALNNEAFDKLTGPVTASAVQAVRSLEDALGGLDTKLGKTTEEAKKAAAPQAQPADFAAPADGPVRPRRGLLNEAESQARRIQRGTREGPRNGFILGNTDRLALADLERRQNNRRPLSPAAAARELARGGAAADPGRNRRQEREEQKQKAADPLLAEVREIRAQFENLATA